MSLEAGILEKGLLAALDLAAETPWVDLTLAAIADKADVPLSDFHGLSGKDKLASLVDAHFDRAMSAEGVSPDDSPRERLFDVIMLRFEAMEAYRAGLLSLMRYRDRTPSLLLGLAAARKRTADWALVSAGLDNGRFAPPGLKAIAIAFVIASAERAWRRETSGDFALTMAALDRGLREAEDRMETMRRVTGWGRRDRRPDEPADTTTDGETPE